MNINIATSQLRVMQAATDVDPSAEAHGAAEQPNRSRTRRRNKNTERFDEDTDLRTGQPIFEDLNFRRCDEKKHYQCVLKLNLPGQLNATDIEVDTDGKLVCILAKSELRCPRESVSHGIRATFPVPARCDIERLRAVLLPGGCLKLIVPYAAEMPPRRRLRNMVVLPVEHER